MSTIPTGHKCRCPGCREIVDRGVREADSQLVAICEPCGDPLLDIRQAPPQPLTTPSRNSLLDIETDPVQSESTASIIDRYNRLRGEIPHRNFLKAIGIGVSRKSGKVLDRFTADLESGHLNGFRAGALKSALNAYEKKTTEEPPMSYASASTQANAIQALDDLIAAIPDMAVTQLALEIGYKSKGALHQRRSQFKNHCLSVAAAQEMIDLIVAYRGEADRTQETEAGASSEPATPAEEAGKQEVPAANEEIEVDESDQGWLEIPDEAVRIAAVKLVESAFGIDLEEMKALRAPIEHMAVCRRNGIRCSVVTDAIEVR